MNVLNEKLRCSRCFVYYYGPGDHKCPSGPLLNEDGVSLTNIKHPRPWHWRISSLWYRLFPPKIDEATLESILIAIRKQVDAGGKKILIKPTKVIYRPADRE